MDSSLYLVVHIIFDILMLTIAKGSSNQGNFSLYVQYKGSHHTAKAIHNVRADTTLAYLHDMVRHQLNDRLPDNALGPVHGKQIQRIRLLLCGQELTGMDDSISDVGISAGDNLVVEVVDRHDNPEGVCLCSIHCTVYISFYFKICDLWNSF